MKSFVLLILALVGVSLLSLSSWLTLLRQQIPRSHEITYVSFGQQAGIYNMYLGREPKAILSEAQTSYITPRWSPDGSTLMYGRYLIGQIDLYQIERGEREAQRISYFFGTAWGGVWSVDSTEIIFSSNMGIGNNLYRMGLDGANLIPLTNTQNSNFDPAWHGEQVVFVSLRDVDLEIYLLGLESGEVKRLTNRPGDDMYPSWSPDGEWILYASLVNSQLDLYKIRPDGTDMQAVTQTQNRDEYYGAWSPDGEKIVFASTPDYSANAPNWDLEMMNTDGSNRQFILNNQLNSEVMPSWMPILESPWRGGGMMLLGAIFGLGALYKLI